MLKCMNKGCIEWQSGIDHNCNDWQPTVSCGFQPEEGVEMTFGGVTPTQLKTHSEMTALRVGQMHKKMDEIFKERPATHPEIVTANRLARICDETKALLLEKNKAYGDSASSPIGVFSNGTPLESICVRIDDKLNRIMKGSEYPGDDTIQDLIGYLILYRAVKEETDVNTPT